MIGVPCLRRGDVRVATIQYAAFQHKIATVILGGLHPFRRNHVVEVLHRNDSRWRCSHVHRRHIGHNRDNIVGTSVDCGRFRCDPVRIVSKGNVTIQHRAVCGRIFNIQADFVDEESRFKTFILINDGNCCLTTLESRTYKCSLASLGNQRSASATSRFLGTLSVANIGTNEVQRPLGGKYLIQYGHAGVGKIRLHYS